MGLGLGSHTPPTRTLLPTILLREEFRKRPSSPTCDDGLGLQARRVAHPTFFGFFFLFCFVLFYVLLAFPPFSSAPLPHFPPSVMHFYSLCDVAILVAGKAVSISSNIYYHPSSPWPLALHPLPSLLFDKKQGIWTNFLVEFSMWICSYFMAPERKQLRFFFLSFSF